MRALEIRLQIDALRERAISVAAWRLKMMRPEVRWLYRRTSGRWRQRQINREERAHTAALTAQLEREELAKRQPQIAWLERKLDRMEGR